MTELHREQTAQGFPLRFLSRLHGQQVTVTENIASPNTPEGVAHILDACREENIPLTYNLKQGLKQGSEKDSPKLGLDMSALNRVLRFRPEEQLITVQSGIRMAEIERVLRAERLQLPFLYPANTTLFRVLNTQPSSLSVHRHAQLAHWVTGLEAITGNGKLLHYGGDVVKNVTGYDLTRLFIGSQGSFGLITAATLRVIPQPSHQRLSVWHFDSLNDALLFIRQSRLLELPCIDSALLTRTRNVFGLKFLLRLVGVEADISRALQYLQQQYQQVKRVSIPVDFLDADILWEWTEKLNWEEEAEQSSDRHWLLIQAALPTSALLQLDTLGDATVRSLQEADWVWNGLGNTLTVRWSTRSNFPENTHFRSLRQEFEAQGGRLRILSAPQNNTAEDNVLTTLLASMSSEPEKTWARRLKAELDPQQLLPEYRAFTHTHRD